MKRSDGTHGDRVDALLDRLRLDESDGPALPIADDAALELVRRARERCAPLPPAKLPSLPRWPLIGVAVVVASSAAAAALGELPDWLGMRPPPAAPPSVATAATSAGNQPRPAATSRPAPPAPAAGDVAPSEVLAVEPATAAPARIPLPAEAARAAPAASKRATPAAPGARADRTAPLEPAPDSPRAADLLGAANRARATRSYAAALDLYREVLERYPQTRQAQIAALAAGELELERGNARAAEPLFQRVPQQAQLGAEALFGLSEAYRAEGRVVEERRALDRFVHLYPSNPLAAAARRRLSQLEAAGRTK